MRVEVRPTTVADLEARLRCFEERYGVPSERLGDAFADGETDDLREWSGVYRTWLAVTRAAVR